MLFSLLAPLIFWLMGTVVIIFLRPRDERWLVLVLFSYVTAVWIAAGLGQRTAGAAFVFHAVIWFFLPLSVHLHTILPSELFGRRVAASLADRPLPAGRWSWRSSTRSSCCSGSNTRSSGRP